MPPNPIALAIPFFFALIGVELVVARAMGLRPYRFNDAIVDLSCGITQTVTKVFLGVVALLPYVWVHEHLRVVTLADGAWSTHLFAFLGVDLAYYAWHRWTHQTNLGWTTHVVHHQSEDYNLAVALRQSVTSPLSSWPFFLPLAALGVSPIVAFTHVALNTLYQFWIHTETIGKLGPLEWVLNTPSHHRVHHAINPEYVDRNYAGVLIVWDRLLGTFEPEVAEPVYGTVEPMRSFNPLWANVWYLSLLARDTAAARTWSERAKVWLGPPGYRPEGLPPHPRPRPITRAEVAKYDPSGPPGLAPYVLVHFVPVAIATTAMLLFEHGHTGWLAVTMALVLATVTAWGGFFERKAWALPLEIARLVAAGIALTVALLGTPSAWVLAPSWLFVGASLAWVWRLRG